MTLPFAALLLERLLRLARPANDHLLGLRPARGLSLQPAAARRSAGRIRCWRRLARCPARRPLRSAWASCSSAWTAPLFAGETEAEQRLRQAVCLLSDIAWRDHPDYRAEQAFRRILRLPIGGIEHGERVFAAAAVAARYVGSLEPVASEPVLRLIDEATTSRALVLGLALGLPIRSPGRRRACWTRRSCASRGSLTLMLPKDGAVMYGEAVDRRLEALGRALGRRGTAAAHGKCRTHGLREREV